MSHLPRRRFDVVVSELSGDALVIFDPTTDRAHALHGPAATLWPLCDGIGTSEAAARLLGVDVHSVESATAEIVAAGLAHADAVTRRRALQGGALVAGAALVSTVVVPRAAAAASGGGGGGTGSAPPPPPPGVIDVNNVDSGTSLAYYIGSANDERVALQFSVGTTGSLTGVGLVVGQFSGDTTQPLLVSINAYSPPTPGPNGTATAPPGAALASASVISSTLPVDPNYAITYVTFATPVPVTVGDIYYLLLSAPTTVKNYWYAPAAGTTGPLLGDVFGPIWRSYTGLVIGQYQTFIQP